MTDQPPPDHVPRRMHHLGWAGAFLAFVLAVTMGFSMWRGAERRDVTPLPVLRAVPDFTLTDQTGAPVSKESLRGNIWITDFFFTRCLGPCPLLTARMAELQKALTKAPTVKLVSISVDPAHDTPEVLAEYGRQHHAEPDRWKFLTGDPATVRRIVTEGFLQTVGEDDKGELLHGTTFMLVDGNGMVRGVYMLEDPELMQKILTDTGNLLREQGAGPSAP
jgi:protein SCO1/2